MGLRGCVDVQTGADLKRKIVILDSLMIVVFGIKLEWFSRDNLWSLMFVLVTHRHVKNLFTHLFARSQITSCLDSRFFFNIYEPKISIDDIYTSQ